jgi:hypothetical protein
MSVSVYLTVYLSSHLYTHQSIVITLQNNNIGPEGAQYIMQGLQHNTSITHIDLRVCNKIDPTVAIPVNPILSLSLSLSLYSVSEYLNVSLSHMCINQS